MTLPTNCSAAASAAAAGKYTLIVTHASGSASNAATDIQVRGLRMANLHGNVGEHGIPCPGTTTCGEPAGCRVASSVLTDRSHAMVTERTESANLGSLPPGRRDQARNEG